MLINAVSGWVTKILQQARIYKKQSSLMFLVYNGVKYNIVNTLTASERPESDSEANVKTGDQDMGAAYYEGYAFSLKFQDFLYPNTNYDSTDQWGIAFCLKGCPPLPFWCRNHRDETINFTETQREKS